MKKDIELKLQTGYLLILLTLGCLWVVSDVEKIASGEFPQNMQKTLLFFASRNPYEFYKVFLENVAIPNSYIFGLMVELGELTVGVGLIGMVWVLYKGRFNRLKLKLSLIILIIGLLLNLNFWLASAWTSPSTSYINLLMAAIEAITFYQFLRLLQKGVA